MRGFGLQRGALGSTVAHDAHNIVVVGVDDGDMARAVQRLVELGGGIVAVESRGVRAELPLPVAGLLSDAPLADVVDAEPRLQRGGGRSSAAPSRTPFLTLSFLALSVIPKLKITDHGLVDVDRFEIVPLAYSRVASHGQRAERLAGVHPVLGLVVDDGLRAVDDLVGHLGAAVGRAGSACRGRPASPVPYAVRRRSSRGRRADSASAFCSSVNASMRPHDFG